LLNQPFGFQKTRLRGMVKNRCKVNLLAAMTNLFLAGRQLLAAP
jgi:IS5 family transposase